MECESEECEPAVEVTRMDSGFSSQDDDEPDRRAVRSGNSNMSYQQTQARLLVGLADQIRPLCANLQRREIVQYER
jgi:hypothetical protein